MGDPLRSLRGNQTAPSDWDCAGVSGAAEIQFATAAVVPASPHWYTGVISSPCRSAYAPPRLICSTPGYPYWSWFASSGREQTVGQLLCAGVFISAWTMPLVPSDSMLCV